MTSFKLTRLFIASGLAMLVAAHVGAADFQSKTSKPGRAMDITQKKNPPRAGNKADLVVYFINFNKVDDPKRMYAVVRNNGKAKSGSAVITASVLGRPGVKGEGTIPALDVYHANEVEVKFNQPLQEGDRIVFTADGKHHVSESNEKNNSKNYTY